MTILRIALHVLLGLCLVAEPLELRDALTPTGELPCGGCCSDGAASGSELLVEALPADEAPGEDCCGETEGHSIPRHGGACCCVLVLLNDAPAVEVGALSMRGWLADDAPRLHGIREVPDTPPPRIG